MASGSPLEGRPWITIAVPVFLGLVIFAAVRPDGGHRAQVNSRGPGHRPAEARAVMPSPELLTFRIGKDGRPEPLGDVVRRDDELAFAYRTDGTARRVLVFARDGSGQVYWYHPAWTNAAENPEGIPVAREAGVHELPAAVAQPFQGEWVEICALFTADALRVREVEQGLPLGKFRPDCRKVTVAP